MLEKLTDTAAVERGRGGLFGLHLDSFIATVTHLGYARSTMRERLRLSKMPPLNVKLGRFRPDDKLLAFLEGL